uniref:Uncharacterized protein n=1 Tax=Manihot esculenta TaxID=3983 RepID=A0A2C9VW46_MANES
MQRVEYCKRRDQAPPIGDWSLAFINFYLQCMWVGSRISKFI